MTTYSTDISGKKTDEKGFLARWLDRISRSMERQAHVLSRRDLIEMLEAKSDKELAALGVRRDQIAHYVFRDLFYA